MLLPCPAYFDSPSQPETPRNLLKASPATDNGTSMPVFVPVSSLMRSLGFCLRGIAFDTDPKTSEGSLLLAEIRARSSLRQELGQLAIS